MSSARSRDSTLHPRDAKRPQARRILIYRFGQLGDTLIALPSLKAVRRRFPDAYIALLSAASNRQRWVGIEEVLPPGLVDHFISYDVDGAGVRKHSKVHLLRLLRAQRYDLLVYLVPRTRAPLDILRDRVFFRLAGIRRIVGHTGFAPLPQRLRDAELPMLEHEAEHLLGRLQRSGIGLGESAADNLPLDLTDAESAQAREWLSMQRFDSASGQCLVGFGPGSKWPSKCWPEQRYGELLTRLVTEYGVTPVVFGGADERDLAERLIATAGKGLNAAGKLPVRLAAGVLQHCALYVGNDTGTMHLAAAVGTPCVGVYSAQDWPGRWYPYGSRHVVLRKPLPCEGCNLVECVEHDIACLRAISVAEVFDACHSFLKHPISAVEGRA